jgi:hypothetical protein
VDLLRLELRSFVAGAAIVGALWAWAHACALERAPDDAQPYTRLNIAAAPPAKREAPELEELDDAGAEDSRVK